MKKFYQMAKGMVLGIMLAASVAFAQAQDERVIIDPAPGDVSELSTFILNFDGDWTLGTNRRGRITMTGPEGVTIPTIQNQSLGPEGYYIGFEDDAVITAAGDYTLTIPAGKFAIDNIDLGDLVFNYTIVPGAAGDYYNGSVEIDPAEGSYEAIDMFLLTFDSAVEVANPDKITLTSAAGRVEIIAMAEDEYLQVLINNENYMLEAPGEYALVIEEGALLIGDKPNRKLEYEYTIANGSSLADFPRYVMTPAPGSYETIDEGFRLAFDTEEDLTCDAEMIFMNGPKGEVPVSVEVPHGMAYILIIPVNEAGMPIELTDAGDYTLVIGYHAVTIGDKSNDEPILFEYSLSGAGLGHWTDQIEVTPADGSVVDEIRDITITFIDAARVGVSDTAGPNEFPTLYDAEGNFVARGIAFADDNILYLSFPGGVSASGEYKMVLKASFFTVDGAHSTHDIVLHYAIEAKAPAFEYSYSFTPAAGEFSDTNQPFTIVFSGSELASVDYNIYAWGTEMPHFTNPNGFYNPNLLVNQNGFVVEFTHQWPFEEAGVYTLIIPAGYFTLTDNAGAQAKNDRIEVEYTLVLSGIEGIEADGAQGKTYTISGVRVKNGSALPAGIYVVGGKKVIVK